MSSADISCGTITGESLKVNSIPHHFVVLDNTLLFGGRFLTSACILVLICQNKYFVLDNESTLV